MDTFVSALPPLYPTTNKAPILLVFQKPSRVSQMHGMSCVDGGELRTLQRIAAARIHPSSLAIAFVRPSITDDDEQITINDLKIKNLIVENKPNLAIFVGSALSAAIDGDIAEYRGSLLRPTKEPFLGLTKIIGIHDDESIVIDYTLNSITEIDLAKAAVEAASPDLTLPVRQLVTDLTYNDALSLLRKWPTGVACSLDIEGGLTGWPCVSLCAQPNYSVTLVWSKYPEQERFNLMRAFACLMRRSDVPKILQNSLYDSFVLHFGFAIQINNVVSDTMLKAWEFESEFPKGLGFLASLYTNEPFYKSERKSDNAETYYKYCAKDSAVTLEIDRALEHKLTDPLNRGHYQANVLGLNPLLYMELRGIRYDQEAAKIALEKTSAEMHRVGDAVCSTVGRDIRGPSGSLSAKKLQKCLYEELGYPVQLKDTPKGKNAEATTADVVALLTLAKLKPNDQLIKNILLFRHLEGVVKTLRIGCDPDGRVRCGYNIVGTETGRLTCYTSPTGAGANLQTIPSKWRHLYLADEGYSFFQCDLSGADGWTVAAHCAALGAGQMLEEYYRGIKPAKVIALMYKLGAVVSQLDLDAIKENCRGVTDDWLYAGCKAVQHGTNYQMGSPTVCTTLLKQSYKKSGEPIYLPITIAKQLQMMYESRYRVSMWHNFSQAKISASKGKPTLTSASGHTRRFHGGTFSSRLSTTLRAYLADEPQQNTTYATNLAMSRLWSDPDNRIALITQYSVVTISNINLPLDTKKYPALRVGGLIIEPLHSIHDALAGQFPTPLYQFAKKKIREWFDNTLVISNHKIVIPYEGAAGTSWGTTDKKNLPL